MASTQLSTLTLLFFILFTVTCISRADTDANLSLQLATADELEWPSAMSLFDRELEGENDGGEDGYTGRRSLFWRRMRYYISYGALSANRIPCPPRSGRSYYTHNCYKARGPAHPYTRGCSAITRCAR